MGLVRWMCLQFVHAFFASGGAAGADWVDGVTFYLSKRISTSYIRGSSEHTFRVLQASHEKALFLGCLLRVGGLDISTARFNHGRQSERILA